VGSRIIYATANREVKPFQPLQSKLKRMRLYLNMKNTKCFITSLIVFVIFSSCSYTSVYQPLLAKQYPDLNINEASTVIITGDDDIKIRDFIKPFNKEYPQSNDFVNNYIDELSALLVSKKVFSKVYSDKSARPDKANRMSFLEQKEDSLFNMTHADYIIRITNIEVSSSIVREMQNNLPSHTTICKLSLHLQIFETKMHQKIMEIVDEGNTMVGTFQKRSAIKRAATISIYHAADYLKTGKTKFTY
jgi:hypothetical protein